jgi:hypothetical protein
MQEKNEILDLRLLDLRAAFMINCAQLSAKHRIEKRN